MNLIAETKQWDIGPYTVLQRMRPDNPYWPVYIVVRRNRIVGRSFSIPDRGCCEWLEHWGDHYAKPSEIEWQRATDAQQARARAGRASASFHRWTKAVAETA